MKGPGRTRRNYLKGLILFTVALLCAIGIFAMQSENLPDREPTAETEQPAAIAPTLLTDPFLQRPMASSVNVVWFTEFEGTEHVVEYGQGLRVIASTTELSQMYEDSDSQLKARSYEVLTPRPIWRHEAIVSDLSAGDRVPYRVISRSEDDGGDGGEEGQEVVSDFFSLAPSPPAGQPLKILLTSDHQMKPMTPANLQKVEETIGRLDAVFFAGDLVNVPDRASEWFGATEAPSFFPTLQGKVWQAVDNANGAADSSVGYRGGQIIQNAPLFPIIGNHEVMGRRSITESLKAQFSNTLPREQVEALYPDEQLSEKEIEDRSYNVTTYKEIFSLPTAKLPDGTEKEEYYAVSIGDVRLVSLYVTQIWRSPDLSPNTKGRYRESAEDIENPQNWGYGQHIFEDIREGSEQYNWLQQELASSEFQQAKYKIVMLHHPPHTLGGNIVPAFTDPVMVENKDESGNLVSVQYEYPKENDYIIRDLMPLLEASNTQLVFYGHSHLWNRFESESGLNFLETSNVGNSYGAHLGENLRAVPDDEAVAAAGDLQPFEQSYDAVGDPNGLTPVVGTVAPLEDESGTALPYIASNEITSFTILDTGTGLISSYYFDTTNPSSEVVKFDEFQIDSRASAEESASAQS